MLNYTETKHSNPFEQLLMSKYQTSALTVEEVANELKVETSDILKLLESGDIRYLNIGSKKRIMINELVGFLSADDNNVRQKKTHNGQHMVTDILKIVLDRKKRECKKLSSYNWYCILSKHIVSYFDSTSIENLDSKAITKFSKELSKSHSYHLVKVVNCLLKNVVSIALQEHYISSNPYDYVKKINNGKKNDSRKRFLSDQTLSRLIMALEHSPTFRPIVKLMVNSGIRIGEALALRWYDIDRANGVIHVEKGLSLEYDEDENGNLINKRYEIGDTKTICSVRDVPVETEVFDAIDEWRNHVNNNSKLCQKIKEKHNEDYVFINRYGDLRSYQSFQKSFKRFLKDHGLENENITFHKFRHTYATLLQESGADINVIRDLLGHADIETTANIYAMVKDEPKRAAAKKLSKKLKSIY